MVVWNCALRTNWLQPSVPVLLLLTVASVTPPHTPDQVLILLIKFIKHLRAVGLLSSQ